jgi:hypothetical protein
VEVGRIFIFASRQYYFFLSKVDSGFTPASREQSVKQYENGIKLQRTHACAVLSSHLRQRSSPINTLKRLHQSHILPDVESSSILFSRTLLPVVRRLKWSLQKDRFAQVIRDGGLGLEIVGDSEHQGDRMRYIEASYAQYVEAS